MERAEKEASFRQRHPTLSAIYDQLPGYPDIPGDRSPIGVLLESIIKGLGFGGQSQAYGKAYDMFGAPIGPSTNIDMRVGSPTVGKTLYQPITSEYPDPETGEYTVPPDQQLPPMTNDPDFVSGPARMFGVTPQDVQRWDSVLTKNVTDVKKNKAKAPKTGWDAIINGLGNYGN